MVHIWLGILTSQDDGDRVDIHKASGWRTEVARADHVGDIAPGLSGTLSLHRAPEWRHSRLAFTWVQFCVKQKMMIHPDSADLVSEMNVYHCHHELEGFDFSL